MASLKKIRRKLEKLRLEKLRLETALAKAEAELRRLAFTALARPLKSVLAEGESVKLEQRVIPAEALTLADVALVKRLAQVVGGRQIRTIGSATLFDDRGEFERGPEVLAVVRNPAREAGHGAAECCEPPASVAVTVAHAGA